MTTKLIPMLPPLRTACRAILTLTAALGLTAAAWAADQPLFTNLTLLPDQHLQIQLTTVPGQSYTIEFSTNLSTWLAVGSLENVQTNLLTLVDPEPVSANACRFYRVKVGSTPTFGIFFMHEIDGGSFAAAPTPIVSYPAPIRAYSVMFDVQNDAPYPDPSTVRFTGPAGSGLVDTPTGESDTSRAWYQSPWISNPPTAPGGQWLIAYRGSYLPFNAPDPQAASRQVLPVPTVSVVGGMLQIVSWVYRAPDTGAPISTRPAFITSIQVQIQGMDGRLYNSPEIEDPVINYQTVSPAVTWSTVTTVTMAYNDTLGNHYVTFFRKP